MALFSRRPKDAADQAAPTDDADVADGADATASDAPIDAGEGDTSHGDADAAGADDAPAVGISMTSFRGLGSQAPAAPPAADDAPPSEAPAAGSPGAAFRRNPTDAQTIPGLTDNVVLRAALARLPEKPTPQQVLDVARQAMQGHLYLRVKGDARALIAEGKDLPLAAATIGDRRFAIAYSSGGALAASIVADGDADTSAMGQPALAVLRHVLAGDAEGLVIDPASSPARVILPRQLIERMLESVDETLAVKTLLVGERTDGTAAAVVDALTRAPLWAAVGRSEEGAPLGLAEGRAEDGSRYLEVASHPLEIVAAARSDQPVPITAVQLATALARDEKLTGIVVDPRGPGIRLSRAELAPLLALATAPGE